MAACTRLGALRRHLQPTAAAPAAAAPLEADDAAEPMGAKLLTDAQMMDFVREGFAMFHLDDLPRSYHDGVIETLDKAFEQHGNPGNNMLPMCPQLSTMLNHPLVDGCLQSVLGSDYYVHLHRHPHMRDNVDEGPPGKVHGLHKDSMYNSRFAADATRRQHRTRMCMLIYFPQDTPVELGPTAIMPRSHFLLHSPPGGVNTVPYEPEAEAIHLAGPAGTVGIIHYDMLHSSSNKGLLQKRHSASCLALPAFRPQKAALLRAAL